MTQRRPQGTSASSVRAFPGSKLKPKPSSNPPGSPILGIVLGVIVGLVVAVGGAWVYAYVDLYFPLWSILITLGFGALLGYAPALVMVGGGLRQRMIGFPLVALIAFVGYWLSWAVWIHAAMNKTDEAPSVSALLASPSELWSWIGTVREVGIWTFNGHGDPVHGGMLAAVWIGEAILILGAALAAGWHTLENNLPG